MSIAQWGAGSLSAARFSGGSGSTAGTRATDDSLLSSSREQERRRAWNELVDVKLVEWGRNPGRFDEQDVAPPTPAAIRAAIQAALNWRDSAAGGDQAYGGTPVPAWVVPDGVGGIIFQWGEPAQAMLTYEFTASGRAWLTLTRSCRELHRQVVG